MRTRVERLLGKASGHWPVITFDRSLSIFFNGEEVRALSVPGGHTDNDIVVVFTESNVVHLGDLFNSGTSSFPVVDFEAGGNALTILDNIEHLLEIVPDDAVVIAGHGPLSDKEELHRVRDMLEETIELRTGASGRGSDRRGDPRRGPGAEVRRLGLGLHAGGRLDRGDLPESRASPSRLIQTEENPRALDDLDAVARARAYRASTCR